MDSVEVKLGIKGEWWDEFWEMRDGVLVPVHITKPKLNTRMDNALVLICALWANSGGYGGILQHAQGRGNPGWSPTPPAPATSDTTLYDEAGRNAPDSIVFLDPFDVVVPGPTNIIRVRTTYGLADLAGETLREQALFGGDATSTPDSGLIVNTIRHAALYKSGAVQLIRNIKLTLT